MTAKLTTRRPEPSDFDAWFDLFEEVAAEGRWIGAEAPVSVTWARPMFEKYLVADGPAMFLAELDGDLVGVLHVDIALGVGELGMMVRDGYRRRGIGSVLMDECVAWCRASGAHKVILSHWPHNEAAAALYQKYGFETEGRRLRQWRRRSGELWDMIEMGLILDTTSPGSTS